MDARLLLSCLLSTAAVFGQNTIPICPSRRYQLHQVNGTSYCYLYVASPLTYAAANRSCFRDGAILLSILSVDENVYIRNDFFTRNNNKEFWIGLNDIIEEGTFKWENSSAGQLITYANWSSEFPHDNRASRDCVKFSIDGWRVHDFPCSSPGSELPFICKSNTCESEDGEVCLDSMVTEVPAPLVSPGGISAIVIVLIVVIAVLIIVVVMFFLWKFKNDIFNRFCCWCCGGAERSKVRNLQQENQRLRQQLSQHRLSVSGRMPPGQFSNALSGVPDGRGGVLPAIKQPISPMDDRQAPFLTSAVGGGPPPLNIQRQTSLTTPGPLIGGRPSLTTPSGALPRSIFTGSTPIRPVRQSAPIFSGAAPLVLPQMNKPGLSNGTRAGPIATETVPEEEESESSEESDEEEAGPGSGRAESKPDPKEDEDKDSQQE